MLVSGRTFAQLAGFDFAGVSVKGRA